MGLFSLPNCSCITSYQHLFHGTPIVIILFRFCQTRWVEDRPVADLAVEVWPSVLKVINYWEGLCKSSRPIIKSYEVVVHYYTDG